MVKTSLIYNIHIKHALFYKCLLFLVNINYWKCFLVHEMENNTNNLSPFSIVAVISIAGTAEYGRFWFARWRNNKRIGPSDMGPLKGLRVIEIAGIGPAPFAGMMLADMGAEVVRIDRQDVTDLGLPGDVEAKYHVLNRGRRSLVLDLKTVKGRKIVEQLIPKAHALIEGFRPGVMERLGLGPEQCLKLNPKLVFGRMTGYGQTGPQPGSDSAPAPSNMAGSSMTARAGHDINYIALAGVLHGLGAGDRPPVPPLNLVGDFGGGGMMLAFGVMAALWEAQRSGKGQVVDAAMVDGAASLMAMMYGLHSAGHWQDTRAANALDGAAPWYATYATQDGKYLAVGAIEGRFYRELIAKLELGDADLPDQHDRDRWPELRSALAARIGSRTRAHWETVFAGSDACVAPVLSLSEAPDHPHNRARGTFYQTDGVTQPAPSPRFSRTQPRPVAAPGRPGADGAAVLADWGFSAAAIAELTATGAIGLG
jgi:alpha-methylacyl-CoA racemase